ncbi:MAG TPA: ABC transporter permease [Acidimicrobiaceae bacterium]|jgi:simple sugar transport system permease protein|nr:ABC transporter permease [Acidimicrobiales bacterium]HCV36466.1 ABC transporter permease [Acidimicrobiaceae bacterium]HJO80752.1 ABC transporter permease [Acidimicrobiales bacterium]|tara:strand:+ start:4090 stop:5019 length:930 start_codon:yes stop_codon:yes gene_type:complete
MGDFFTLSVLVATVASAIRLATPYLLAALGETIGQRSGVLNLGVDGVMLLSAFFSYWTVLETGNLWLAVFVGLVVGLVMGLLYGVITVGLSATQGISGIGIFIFGLGLSDLLFRQLVGTPKPVRRLPKVDIPILSDIPHLGKALFHHSLLTYLAFVLVPVTTLLLSRTIFGLNIRSVGENPQAADSLGVSVERTRFMAILIGNSMAGLAGAALVLQLGIFQPNLTQGLGFIAVALVYFGAWRPIGVMGGALLYGLVNATVLQWKALGIIPVSGSDLANMAPAVLTILALIVVARRVHAPSALTKPFGRH